IPAGRNVELRQAPGGDRPAEAGADDADVYLLRHAGLLSRQVSLLRALARELAAVAEARVAVGRGPRIAHDPVAGAVATRADRMLDRGAERGKGDRRGRLPQRPRSVPEVESREADLHPLVEGQGEEGPALRQCASVQVG